MFWVGYLLAFLATTVVGWAVPIVGVALLLPLFQLICILNPWVAMVLMILLVSLLVGHLLYRQAYWQAIFWGALWGMGAFTALTGWFNWYALFVEGILLIILLVPGIVTPAWARLLRWYATGELLLTLFLIWGQGQGLPGTVLVMALLLMALSVLVGAGAYRPFEARRMRRRLATLAAIIAVVLLLWQPVVLPTSQWLGQVALPQTAAALSQVANSVGQTISTSPVGRWYHVMALRWEREEIGEASKTEALRQIWGPLTEAHKARWERGISQIPQLPLTGGEWGDLGVPRQADP
jgi:hypothetical protein